MYIFGVGGHGKSIIDMVSSDCKIPIQGLLDDNEFGNLMGIPIKKLDEIDSLNKSDLHIAIGNNKTRKEIALKLDASYPTLIHPESTISKFTNIGKGSVVMAQSSIKAMTNIGNHCIINAGAVIGHDVNIADYVHVAPNSAIGGFVSIGEGTHIGIGASVIQGIKIGKWSVVGAGAVIIRDVPDYSVVVGNPGKIIKMVDRHDLTP